MAELAAVLRCPANLERTFVILQVFIDESGTHDNPHGMILAGYVGRLGQWLTFQRKWQRLLDRVGVEYFHAKDLRVPPGKGGVFSHLSLSERQAFLDLAKPIVSKNTMFGFTTALKHEEYDRVYVADNRPREVPLDTKYAVAFRVFFSFVPQLIRTSLDRDDLTVHIIQEEGAPGIGDCIRVYGLYKAHADDIQAPSIVGTLATAPKKKYLGLQAADYLANGGFSVERKGFVAGDLLDIEKEASVEVARAISGLRSPVYRLPLDEAVLTELKEHLVILAKDSQALGQYRRTLRTIFHPEAAPSSSRKQRS